MAYERVELIKKVVETRTYLVYGYAQSSDPKFYERDFKELGKRQVGKTVIAEAHPLREMTESEVALAEEL